MSVGIQSALASKMLVEYREHFGCVNEIINELSIVHSRIYDVSVRHMNSYAEIKNSFPALKRVLAEKKVSKKALKKANVSEALIKEIWGVQK